MKNGTIEADEPFLPQVGFNWSISDDMEWFGSAARNVRAFASSGTSGPFSTTAAGFEAIRDVLEPETANNYETGLRFRGAVVRGAGRRCITWTSRIASSASTTGRASSATRLCSPTSAA